MGNLIDRYKREVFPEWYPFTSNLDSIRFESDVGKLSWKEWFFGHPSAYKLLFYGANVGFLVWSVPITVFLLVRGNPLAVVFFLLSVFIGWDLSKKYAIRDSIRDVNIYDRFLREEVNVFVDLDWDEFNRVGGNG